ncbi:MAG: hypothetical protein R3E85_05050 [Planctomycetota bacterium]
MAWRIERRSLVDSSLDAGFGVGGVVTVNPTAGVDAFSDRRLTSVPRRHGG